MSDLTSFANLPSPPYFSVIFSSRRTAGDNGYATTADRMLELAAQQRGFLGAESARSNDGFGITVSYWESMEATTSWRTDAEHRLAQGRGKTLWYEHYEVRIAKVERAYRRHSAGPA